MLARLLSRVHPLAASLACLLPSACALCQADAPDALCAPCQARYFPPVRAVCLCCALPLPEGLSAGTAVARCGRCLTQPPAFEATVAACLYVAPADQLVRSLKFGGRLALASLMARLLHQAIAVLPPEARPELLCVAPLGRERLRQRGFNQALEIAKPLARTLDCPLAPRLLLRTRETRPQALLSPAQRQRNLRHAFALHERFASSLTGRHVGVIDDVMTTGATLEEIALTLKLGGAARVTNLVFARTPLQ